MLGQLLVKQVDSCFPSSSYPKSNGSKLVLSTDIWRLSYCMFKADSSALLYGLVLTTFTGSIFVTRHSVQLHHTVWGELRSGGGYMAAEYGPYHNFQALYDSLRTQSYSFLACVKAKAWNLN